MKVSIIMPCYNVENTLLRALDSIIMQTVDFEYEILVIDDASTDHTVELAQKYATLHPQIKVICNKENRGNAYTYYIGLCAAQGDYFYVLDGDDYYTIPDKLQRQVDFLDSDSETEYVGTATQYIIDLGDDMVCIPDRSTYHEFTYTDFLTQHSGYYHTATYMYRNIFRGNVPFSMSDILYRGDTPRTMFHLMYSGKKIKILDFVGSAYTFEFKGIWSGLKQKEQFQYQINYQTKHKENVTTDFEREAADRIIHINQEKLLSAQDDLRRYPAITIDQALQRVMDFAGRFAFGQKDFVLKHAYYSSYMDTLCASLGCINRIRHPEHTQWDVNTGHICIINGVLNPKGGGIFTEISELIDMFVEKHVYLFVTNMNSIPKDAQSILSAHSNLSIICPPQNTEQKLSWFQAKLVEIAPYRCYYYCSHRDTYGAALVQPGTPENVVLFSFDHGYLCGISNPYLTTIAAKRPVDYWMLKKKFGKKVILLPAWSNGVIGCEGYTYQPFHEHDKLITASGAARYYKIDGKPPYRYIDLIIDLLKQSGGIHYHFGELPEIVLDELHEKLAQNGVDQSCFVHIPWAENVPLELLQRNVDIFIEPFPVVSYKLTLQVLSIGVPVIAHVGLMRMEITDFIPKESFFWRTKDEFIKLLTQVDKETLLEKSKQSIQYFNTYHSYNNVKKLFYENKSMDILEPITYPDDTLNDITDSLRMFGNDFKISIIEGLDGLKKKREAEAAKRERERLRKEEQQRLKAEEKRLQEECKKKEEQNKKEKQARNKVMKIRASKSFRLGFAITLPLRFCKQFCIHILKFGLFNGLKKMGDSQLMTYARKNPIDELHVLQNSAAYKLGNALGKPYWFIRFELLEGRKQQMHQLLEKLERQEKLLSQQKAELLETKKIMVDMKADANLVESRLQKSLDKLNKKLTSQAQECNVASQKNLIETYKLSVKYNEILLKTQEVKAIVSDVKKLSNIEEKLVTMNSSIDSSINRQRQEFDKKISRTISNTIAKTLPRKTIEHLDYHLTEHCNLNCVGCSTFAPIADKKFAELSSFEQDIKKLYDLIGDSVQQIHLLGGEPLLHPQAAEFAHICRSVFKNTRIDLTTNGLLIYDMPDSFWEILKDNDIAIKYTQYPVKFDYPKMVEYVKAKGVYVFSAGGENGIRYFRRIPLNTKGTFNMYNSFIQCPYADCAQLRDGKLFHCPASGFSDLLNKRVHQEAEDAGIFRLSKYDYLDLYQAHSGTEIFEFLSNAIPFCQYCDMDHINERVKWEVSKRNIREWIDL